MIAIYRLESRKLGARNWHETSHTTSHWASALQMWIEQTQADVTLEWRIVGEWVKTKIEETE